MINNKKGGEKLLSIWWFLVLGFIGIFVIAGVLLNFSANVDTKEVEAGILYDKIAGCLIHQGFLQEEAIGETFNIYLKCGLNKEIFDGNIFYFRMQFFDEEKGKLREDIKSGRVNFETECGIQEENKEGEKPKAVYFPKCIPKKENFLYYKNGEVKKGSLEILTASNQVGEKMPPFVSGEN